ncbi:STAS domain-containing protein [Deinococcus yavapaiensis]|uniref:Anti-sigma factor antagonist n=1 Tax=Deinococcus yavapaiensis KR-236 TaxID=694435 RepID=A0A318S430_9DEIO|nr:STAS domain-containing protein [Deinococcus yavapaiensis]PYE49902.1 anti-sigma B factor antagonist [Deinococcus yavapaiensis KR-236]
MIEWTQPTPGVAHFTITGRLDAHEAPKLRESFERAREAGASRFEVAMDRVDFMDSSGLAAVVSGLKASRLEGGELIIVSPSPMVRKVLELTLLDQVIPIANAASSGEGSS